MWFNLSPFLGFDSFRQIMASRSFCVLGLRKTNHSCNIQRTWRESSVLGLLCQKILRKMPSMPQSYRWCKYLLGAGIYLIVKSNVVIIAEYYFFLSFSKFRLIHSFSQKDVSNFLFMSLCVCRHRSYAQKCTFRLNILLSHSVWAIAVSNRWEHIADTN